MNIGKRLKEMRIKQNISMNALAKTVGIAQSGLSEIEAGKRQPAFDTTCKLIEALGFSLPEFFSEETPQLSPELQKLINASKHLSKAEIQKLTEFIELRKEI